MQVPGALKPNLEKTNKKNPPRKNFLYFWKWNFLALRLKNYFYFRKWNFTVLYLSYPSGNRTLQTPKVRQSALKRFLTFQNMELSSLKLKKLLIFQEGI